MHDHTHSENQSFIGVKRFYLLDILRGIAAICVVIFHYQHFYFTAPQTLPDSFSPSEMPFYAAIGAVYRYGWSAVELFFVLSGFIFFFQYGEKVRSRAVSGCEFSVRRLARLYPLHLATLIFVAAGQFISHESTGQFIVYQCNDVKHFVLNLFFLTDWMPGTWICWSFNGPVWSLSVEVFLYVLFFFFARSMPSSWRWQLVLAAGTVVFGLLVFNANKLHLLGSPIACFYAGGVAYLLWKRVQHSTAMRLWALLVTATALAATITLLFWQFYESAIYCLVFPLIVLLLALWQRATPSAGRRLILVGDISYSTYLLHFPVTLIMIALNQSGITRFNFNSSAAWGVYMISVCVISIASHYYFERPAQTYLRRTLGSLFATGATSIPARQTIDHGKGSAA